MALEKGGFKSAMKFAATGTRRDDSASKGGEKRNKKVSSSLAI